MSYALIEALSKSPDLTYQQLLQALRDELRGKYSQRPQLTACHRESPLFYRKPGLG